MANTINKKSVYTADKISGTVSITEKEEKSAVNEKLEQMNNQIQQMKKMLKNSGSRKSAAAYIAGNFNPTLEMNKIACANSPAQVRRYISGVNAKINTLKKSGGYDTLIKRFRKIISKAEEKITKLQREESLEKKAKELERIKKIKESEKVREKKNTEKRYRKLQEADDVRNAEAITFVPESGAGVDTVAADGISANVQSADVGSGIDVIA